MSYEYDLESWRESTRAATAVAARLLRAAAPQLRPADTWSGAGSSSLPLAGALPGGGMVAVLVSCPMHASVMALSVPAPDADRLARAALAAEAIEYPTAGGPSTTDLLAIDTTGLRAGEHLAVRLPDSADGLSRTIKLYLHGVADVELPQIPIAQAATALRLLASVPSAV